MTAVRPTTTASGRSSPRSTPISATHQSGLVRLEPAEVADRPLVVVVEVRDAVLACDVEATADLGCSSIRQCRHKRRDARMLEE